MHTLLQNLNKNLGRIYRCTGRLNGSFVLLFLFFLASRAASAGTVTATASGGNWNTTTTWAGGAVPLTTDDVVIPSGSAVTVDGTNTCASLKLTGLGGSYAFTVSSLKSLTVTGTVTIENAQAGSNTVTLSVAGTLKAANLVVGAASTGNKNAKVSVGSAGRLEITNNITFNTRGTVAITSGTLALGGSSANISTILASASLSKNTAGTLSTVEFNGTSAQTIPAATYGNIKINNTAGAALGADITTATAGTCILKGNLTVESGTLDANGKTLAATTGQTLQVNNGATFLLSGASAFPTTFPTTTLQPSSTINFSGSGPQTIPSYTYGHIKVNNSSGATLAMALSTTNFKGNLLVESGTLNNGGLAVTSSGTQTLQVANGATLNLTGATTFPQSFGTVSLGATSTVGYLGAVAQVIEGRTYGYLQTGDIGAKTLGGNVTTTNITLSGGNLNVGSGQTLTISGTLSGSAISFDQASTAAFNWASAQAIPVFSYGNLQLSGAGAKTLAGDISAKDISVSSGTLTVGGTQTLAVSGTLAAAAPITLASGSTVSFTATSGNQVIPAYSYTNLSTSGAGTKTLGANVTATNISLSGNTLTVGSGKTLTVSGSLSGSVISFDQASTAAFNWASTQTVPVFSYGNLQLSGAGAKTLAGDISAKDVLVSGGTLTVGGTQTLAVSGTLAAAAPITLASGSTITFTATSGNQVIPVYSYTNLATSGAGTKTLAGNITATNLTVNGGNLNVAASRILTINGNISGSALAFDQASQVSFTAAGAQSIPASTYGTILIGGSGVKSPSGNMAVKNIAFSGTGSLNVAAARTLTISGDLPAGSPVSFDPASTVIFDGASSQTIPVYAYGALQFSGSGTKNLDGALTAGNTTVAAPVDFTNGSISIGANTLTLEVAGSISHTSVSNYVKLTTGKMVVKDLGTGGRTSEFAYPVGTATSYTPAYITNAGALNDFSVNVADGIKNNFNNPINHNVVKKTWNVNRETSNGAVNVTLKLQWNTADEAVDPANPFNNFDRNSSTINHYHNSAWDRLATTPYFDAGGGAYYVSSSSITDFSPFGVGDLTDPLPVKLVDFSVRKENSRALLEWATASEKDNAGFHIQASRDGRTFETVGFVASKEANSSSMQQYRFAEEKSRSGMWYFRLEQADHSGETNYSDVRALDFGNARETVQAYPNPFREELKVAVNLATASEVSLELRDLTGKTVYLQAQKLPSGETLVPVTLEAGQPAGVYFLTVKTQANATTSKVVKL